MRKNQFVNFIYIYPSFLPCLRNVSAPNVPDCDIVGLEFIKCGVPRRIEVFLICSSSLQNKSRTFLFDYEKYKFTVEENVESLFLVLWHKNQ